MRETLVVVDRLDSHGDLLAPPPQNFVDIDCHQCRLARSRASFFSLRRRCRRDRCPSSLWMIGASSSLERTT